MSDDTSESELPSRALESTAPESRLTCDHVCCSTSNNVASALFNAVVRAVVFQSSVLSSTSSKLKSATECAKELEEALVRGAKGSNRTLVDLSNAINAWTAGKKGLMSGVFSSTEDGVAATTTLLLDNDDAWPEAERHKLAIRLVRDYYDTDFQAHCRKSCVDEDALFEHKMSCKFLPVSCPNEGCPASFSKHSQEKHDNRCSYKLIDCRLECGRQIARGEMEAHAAGDCAMREVECPYAELGCQHPVRLGKMSEHLFENAENHLRMLYTAETKVSTRVSALERWAQAVVDDDEHRREGLRAIDTALLTLETKHAELEKSHVGSKSHITKLESRVKDLEATVKKQSAELASFRKTVDGLRQSFAQIAKQ